MLMVLFAVLMICLCTSTKQGRAAAREYLKPLERKALIATVIIWCLVIAGSLLPAPP